MGMVKNSAERTKRTTRRTIVRLRAGIYVISSHKPSFRPFCTIFLHPRSVLGMRNNLAVEFCIKYSHLLQDAFAYEKHHKNRIPEQCRMLFYWCFLNIHELFLHDTVECIRGGDNHIFSQIAV